ncbi:hypothetical protein C9I89_04035 [Photobacterium lipolyticum]|uniref:Uncharacterized protein n=2 Tax=Photobacterium lipolyticum TaxID=266810 RepID=A0A2T3N2V6_9GAMM|nr:hypothetical protein C9I89_04035 [Photobacterium lipolyticum]
MPDLLNELSVMGLHDLPFSEQERGELDQFIAVCSPFFVSVCQQKPDKSQHHLLLGVMTKAQSEAVEDYKQKSQSLQNMKQVFEDTVGAEQADKFVATDSQRLKVIATVWFMVQGYTGIDFSYANDHAEQIAQTLMPDSLIVSDADYSKTQSAEQIRSGFMQAYYVGVKQARKSRQSATLLETIKKWLR